MRVYDGEVESLTEAGQQGRRRARLRDGRRGYAYGTDLCEAGLRGARARRRRGGRGDGADEYAGIPRAPRRGRRSTGCVARSFGDWTTERRVELALAVERAARERDPLVTQVEDTVYADGEARVALANSRGFCGVLRADPVLRVRLRVRGRGRRTA